MQHTLENSNFINLIKQRLIDCFLQSWYADKVNSEVLDMYNNVKTTFGFEQYFDILPNDLRVYCKSKDLEDDFYFIIQCPCYLTLRRKYIKDYYFIRPSMAKCAFFI